MVFQMPVTEKGDPLAGGMTLFRRSQSSSTQFAPQVSARCSGCRRGVIEASYLQPLAQTVGMKTKPRYRWEPDWLYDWRSRFRRVHIAELDLTQDEEWPELYRARFTICSKDNGFRALHLFANEAHLPFFGRTFYENNCGTALVTMIKVVPRRRGERRGRSTSQASRCQRRRARTIREG